MTCQRLVPGVTGTCLCSHFTNIVHGFISSTHPKSAASKLPITHGGGRSPIKGSADIVESPMAIISRYIALVLSEELGGVPSTEFESRNTPNLHKFDSSDQWLFTVVLRTSDQSELGPPLSSSKPGDTYIDTSLDGK